MKNNTGHPEESQQHPQQASLATQFIVNPYLQPADRQSVSTHYSASNPHPKRSRQLYRRSLADTAHTRP